MKRILSITLVLIMVLGLFSGCSLNNKDKKPNESGSLIANATEMSVSDIKLKYGETDENKILPLYNLNPNEQLAISLKYTPTDERAVFSVHTDEKCLEDSKVALMWSPSSYMPTGPKTYEVKPITAPLSNSSTQGLWGNVSTYYIRFNYDITADTEVKLDEPVIVPMSIKSPSTIPDVGYEIIDGNFVLKWSKVEGATSYKIYQRQVFKLLEDVNIAPKGKEEAYKGNFPMLEAEVNANTLSYRDWMGDGKDAMVKVASSEVDGGFIIGAQNQGVNGEYYVTAVVDGKESLFSMGVSTCNLALPMDEASGNAISFSSFETADDLPKTVNLTYVDGSTHAHNVTYHPKSGSSQVTYTIDGTSLKGVVEVKSGSQNIKAEASAPSDTGGFVQVENNIPQNAPTNIPTVNDGKTSAEDIIETKPDSKPSDNKTDNSDKTDTETKEPTIVEQQIENTEKVIKEGNKETVKVAEGTVVNADNAAEEYLALSLIAGKNLICVSAFPEIQNWSILSDVLLKVVYQNPLILGVRSYGYDYGTMTLLVEYDYDTNEMVEKQEEIKKEGKKIIESIITTDMTDAEKRRAIYDYLEENTEYDDAALEAAENNNFMLTDNKHRDAFSLYGILVKKVGVCQSYAYAYDYLCELVDVECITVTGAIFGYLPHAWNKVLIDGEWFTTDVTNNEKSTGVEDFMYENPDSVAEAFCYIEDDMYYREDEEGKYISTSMSHSKYKNCIIDSQNELKNFVKKNAKANSSIEFLATYSTFDSDDVTDALREANVKEIGSSIVIGGYVWCEIKK